MSLKTYSKRKIASTDPNSVNSPISLPVSVPVADPHSHETPDIPQFATKRAVRGPTLLGYFNIIRKPNPAPTLLPQHPESTPTSTPKRQRTSGAETVKQWFLDAGQKSFGMSIFFLDERWRPMSGVRNGLHSWTEQRCGHTQHISPKGFLPVTARKPSLSYFGPGRRVRSLKVHSLGYLQSLAMAVE